MPSLPETFADLYGHAPDGVWSAPGRVNLIGEHTDYNGGLALPIALPHRTSCAASARDDDVLRIASLQEESSVEVRIDEVSAGHPSGWTAYVAGVLWALREAGYAVRGLDVLVDGQVPLGAGLSSSAALECSVAAAASELFGLGLLESAEGREVLAAACQRAENDIAGAPTGGMDQAAAMHCTPAHALRLDCRDGASTQVPFDLDAHDVVLLVTDTRASHALADGQYGARRDSCEKAADLLGVATLREVVGRPLDETLAALPDDELRRRTRHVVTEIERVDSVVDALREGDLAEVGRLFVVSHESLRDDYEVSCTELDLVVDTAVSEGALGARMTGGGFGGSAISLVRAGDVDRVTAAIEEAFTQARLAPPVSFAVTASDSAHRD
ncbi:galactokinase [Knoellia flava TL1]|uniref:Galactokinase n=2 Tax=Knoellia flava TaxID=913969 RepID=A0A8H9KUS3_9MICO|nr:galactokinase [Knoellia flava]KGN34002.1 galactokinase [Knoellia flava TL1]GGB83741.1 galactokinase [Knoellia flava]